MKSVFQPVAILLALLGGCEVQDAQVNTGRSIPGNFPGPVQNVGNMPVNMIRSADGQYAISTDMGSNEALWSIRTSDGRGVSHINFPRGKEGTNGLYYGLAIDGGGTLYAAQGNHDSIAVLHLGPDGKLTPQRVIATKKNDCPAGLALDRRGYLYVCNHNPGPMPVTFGTPSALVIYDAAKGAEIGRYKFDQEHGATPNYLLCVAVKSDGSKAYAASERDGKVYVLDTHDAEHPGLMEKLETGSHPDALLLNKAQTRLYVANGDSDTISVVDTASDRIVGTILLRPQIVRDLAGTTPTGLVLSGDERRLFVTLGDMNAVAVIDTDDSELLGYFPAGAYPTAAVVSPDGKQLLVANAKGTKTKNPDPKNGSAPDAGVLQVVEGNVVSLTIPKEKDLAETTKRVLELCRLTPKHINTDNPLRELSSQIKHVIYIVKENRTYDQVLGDMPQGNGDPKLCLFGREITPNQHALAERFVLMDNFYDCGEVSGDGWVWSTQGIANEYVVRSITYHYSHRGGRFDYEGQNNESLVAGMPGKDLDGKQLSDYPGYKNGHPPIPDVTIAPGGYIWEAAARAGLSFRNYGFFESLPATHDGVLVIPDNYPAATGLLPPGHDLEGVTDYDFRKFDLEYADSEAPEIYFKKTGNPKFLRNRKMYGKYNAPSRFTEWNREFQMMLAKNAVPSLMLLRVPSDHTIGLHADRPSPRSMVADNDYAVGQIVETISRSPIWKSCAIFVIEDDAQDGPDHVDAHRSTCFVISPWIKRHTINHGFHNTDSVLKTMELLLGLGPMSQYDAIAHPMMDWDDQPRNAEPFTAILPDAKWLVERNAAKGSTSPVSPESVMQTEAEKMNFTDADAAPADKLNEMIWKSIKGMDSKMPASPRGLSYLGRGKDDDD